MKQHALAHHTFGIPVVHRHAGARAFRFVIDRFLLLPIGAAIALIWANTAGESYFRFAHAIAFPVNEIGMALFLALIAQELIEAITPGGSLHTWRYWGTPLVGAAGGMLGAAIVYAGYVFLQQETVLAQAWPVACAIDIAAAYYLVKLIAPRTTIVPFVLLLAAFTDAAGLVALALWTPFTERMLAGVGLLLAGVAVAAAMHRSRVREFWPYLTIGGTLSWLGLYWAGIHPALALVPIAPFLPHEPRRGDVFADPVDDDRVHHAEHEWHEVVQVVLLLFGLVNAGVLLNGYDTGTWAILSAALVGRPLGILATVWLGRTAGLHLPRRLGWPELLVAALATSSGFTLALFFASGFLPIGAVLQQVKFGALLTSLGALAAVAVARRLHIGRFAE